MTASKSKEESKDGKEIKWDVHNELVLFTAMTGHKPVGLNKHFQMAWIVDKFTSALNRQVNSEAIWKHLATLYDLSALEEMENVGEYEEVDFSLPSGQFASLQQTKEEKSLEKKSSKKSAKETPKRDSVKETPPVRKETPKAAKEPAQKTPKVVAKAPAPQPSTDTPKSGKSGAKVVTPKSSVKKPEVSKEKREPRELKNLGTPDVKQQPRAKETRSGIKVVKEESPLPTRRSLSSSMTPSGKRPTRGSMATSGAESKVTSPAVSTASSRSSTPVPTPKRRRI